uniref:(northern house mosquito) hypothetical protein n=1 Tax=Culex pipiens TaxID=7175 RepID=A0A8D8FE28_CULPI
MAAAPIIAKPFHSSWTRCGSSARTANFLHPGDQRRRPPKPQHYRRHLRQTPRKALRPTPAMVAAVPSSGHQRRRPRPRRLQRTQRAPLSVRRKASAMPKSRKRSRRKWSGKRPGGWSARRPSWRS